MSMWKIIGALIGFFAAVPAAFFAVRRLSHWFRPIRIIPSINLVLDGSNPEKIIATVTNISNEDQVIVKCTARSAYPVRAAIDRNIKEPLAILRYHKHLLYGPISFEMMKKEPVRITPKERKKFSYSVFCQPMCFFPTPLIQIEIQLSDDRVFHSKRIEIPERWIFKSSRFQ